MGDSIIPAPDEHLTTGWEPDLRPDDTLVRQAVLAHAAGPEASARASGRPWRSTPSWCGARIADRGAVTGPVILKQPLMDAGALIGEVSTLFPPHLGYLMLSPWPTTDMSEHGLILLGHPPLMVRLPGGEHPPSPREVDVREVTDADDLAVAERILVEGYPLPGFEPLQRGELLGPGILEGTTRVWLAEVDGTPSAMSAAHVRAGVTLVEYVATLAPARGRGAGSAVTWAATLADPALPAVLLASDDGRPVYERMGYLAIERWTAWMRPGRKTADAGTRGG